jgi:hypothetical protein
VSQDKGTSRDVTASSAGSPSGQTPIGPESGHPDRFGDDIHAATTQKTPNKIISDDRGKEEQSYFIHILKETENPYTLTRDYGCSLEDLDRLNPGLIAEATHLKPGREIKIPKKPTNP